MQQLLVAMRLDATQQATLQQQCSNSVRRDHQLLFCSKKSSDVYLQISKELFCTV
jgi:hypothetical protein